MSNICLQNLKKKKESNENGVRISKKFDIVIEVGQQDEQLYLDFLKLSTTDLFTPQN